MSGKTKKVVMENSHSALLRLLASSLFQRENHACIETTDWQEVVDTAAKHAVLPLIFSGLKNQPKVSPNLIANVRSRMLGCVMQNEKNLRVQKNLVDIFNEVAIPYAVLKGASVAVHYPQPELRALGDIDVLVYEKDMDRAKEALESNGYRYTHEHEFHACYIKNGVSVEIHREVSVFPESEPGRYVQRHMREALERRREVSLADNCFFALGVEEELISLLAHMERHMVSSGVNLRQVCDWALAVHTYRNQIDDSVLKLLEKCGLLQYARVLTVLSSKYLGMPELEWTRGVDEGTAEFLMNEILQMEGLNKVETHRSLGNAFTKNAEKSLLENYINSINRKACKEFPWLSRCFLMYPVFWLWYPLRWIVRAMCGKREKISLVRLADEATERKRIYAGLKLYQ